MQPGFANRLETQRPHLLPLARRLTTQEADAHILIQDTLSRAYIYRSTYRQDVNLLAWLKTVMRNYYYSEYRRDHNRRRILLEVRAPTLSHTYNDGAYNLLMEQAAAVVATLPPGFRQAFQMRIDGYAYQEIAKALSIPVGTVKSRIFAVRRRLRESL